jgi:hypothetical protein
MGFWGSLFGGSNPTLSSDIKQFGQIGSFATNLGESNLSKSSNYYSSLLSGDASKSAKALAPQIGAAKESAQQDTKKAAEQGTRSGGTAASTAATKDKTRGNITNLLGSLTSSAASGLASSGSSALGTGLSAYGQQVGASQQQMQNWSKSILGHGVTSGVQSLEELGEQYIAGPGQTSAADTYNGPGT